MTENVHDGDSYDLRDFLAPIWRRWWLILVVVFLATAGTYAYNERKPDQFTATTRVFLQASEIDQSLFGASQAFIDPDRNLANQASLLQTPGVARRVAKPIGFTGDPAQLLRSIRVAPSEGSDFMAIRATARTPQRAAAVANGFAAAFIDLRTAKVRSQVSNALRAARAQLARLPTRSANQELRASLNSRISSLEAIDSLAPGEAEQVDRALPPGARSAPKPERAAIFGFALSLVFALLGAVGLERLDRRVRSLSQVGPAYHAPVLAALTHAPRSAFARNKGNPLEILPEFHEAVRGLRTNLRLAKLDEPLRTLIVTSALASEGKSTLVVNLALAYQEAGLRVAVIECDLRRPALAELMGLRPGPGLTEVLAGERDLSDVVQVVDVGARSSQPVAVPAAPTEAESRWALSPGALTVLTSGAQPPDPTSLLATERMHEVLSRAREVTDMVIIDTPPLLAVADGLPLLGLVDGTLVVARIGTANRSSGRHIREVIQRVQGAELLGVVVNDLPESDLGGAYGYGYPSKNGGEPSRRT